MFHFVWCHYVANMSKLLKCVNIVIIGQVIYWLVVKKDFQPIPNICSRQFGSSKSPSCSGTSSTAFAALSSGGFGGVAGGARSGRCSSCFNSPSVSLLWPSVSCQFTASPGVAEGGSGSNWSIVSGLTVWGTLKKSPAQKKWVWMDRAIMTYRLLWSHS